MARDLIARIVTTLAGAVLMIYGLIAAFSPLPAGAPLVILGFLMIAGANPAARPAVRYFRRRWRWFDKLVVLIGKRAPERVKSTIRETAPGLANEESEADK